MFLFRIFGIFPEEFKKISQKKFDDIPKVFDELSKGFDEPPNDFEGFQKKNGEVPIECAYFPN